MYNNYSEPQNLVKHFERRGIVVVVLLIGGAGYIGSHAARTLMRLGHKPIIYDNLSTGHAYLARGFSR
jgi:NADPH-dependent 2,4-dienoyl-CoA reductase/sulfur reductase-like enzyme